MSSVPTVRPKMHEYLSLYWCRNPHVVVLCLNHDSEAQTLCVTLVIGGLCRSPPWCVQRLAPSESFSNTGGGGAAVN